VKNKPHIIHIKTQALLTLVVVVVALFGCIRCSDVSPTSESVQPSLAPIALTTGVSTATTVIRYNDESQKAIRLGNSSFEMSFSHILREFIASNGDSESKTYIIKTDSDFAAWHDISVIDIDVACDPRLEGKDKIVEYLIRLVNNPREIKIYESVDLKEGVVDLYYVADWSGQRCIITCILNADGQWYTIQTDYIGIDQCFAGIGQHPSYKVSYQTVGCADEFSADIVEVSNFSESYFEYTVKPMRYGLALENEPIIFAQIRDIGNGYNLTLTDRSGKQITAYPEFPQGIAPTLQFVDVNRDGYVDLIISNGGTLNELHILYTWDDVKQQFTQVDTEVPLYNFELYEHYIKNWAKSNAGSGVVQTLVWDGNKLIVQATEEYSLD
jgi:hypothetical protein